MIPELLHIRWEETARPDTAPRVVYAEGVMVIATPPGAIICDFCNRAIESEARAVFDGVRGKITIRHGDPQGWWIDGPFAACSNCQVKLGIMPGDQEVALAKVRRLFSIEVKRGMRPQRVRAAFYGPG